MKVADLLAKIPQPYRTIAAVAVLVVAAVAGLGLIPDLGLDTTDVAAHVEDTDAQRRPDAPEAVPPVEPEPATEAPPVTPDVAPEPVGDSP